MSQQRVSMFTEEEYPDPSVITSDFIHELVQTSFEFITELLQDITKLS